MDENCSQSGGHKDQIGYCTKGDITYEKDIGSENPDNLNKHLSI